MYISKSCIHSFRGLFLATIICILLPSCNFPEPPQPLSLYEKIRGKWVVHSAEYSVLKNDFIGRNLTSWEGVTFDLQIKYYYEQNTLAIKVTDTPNDTIFSLISSWKQIWKYTNDGLGFIIPYGSGYVAEFEGIKFEGIHDKFSNVHITINSPDNIKLYLHFTLSPFYVLKKEDLVHYGDGYEEGNTVVFLDLSYNTYVFSLTKQ